MYTLFTIPTSSDVITAVGAHSSSWFTEFLPVVYLIVGMVVAGLAIRFLARTFNKGVRGALGGGKRGRGRRR